MSSLEPFSWLPTKFAAQQALARHNQEDNSAYYENILRAHIVEAFGEKQISAITRLDVESFLAKRVPMYCRNTLCGMRVHSGA